MELSFQDVVYQTMYLLNAVYKTLKESEGEATALTMIQIIVEDACVDDLMLQLERKANGGKNPIFIYEGEN